MLIFTPKNHAQRLFYLLLVIGLLVAFTAVGVAQGEIPSDDEVNHIASQLYCPICENMSLDICPLEACQAWRELIREQLAEGWTEGEIKAYFLAQYGEQVLGEPPRSGLNWILYLLPPLIILTGLVLLVSKMKRPAQPLSDQGNALGGDVNEGDDHTPKDLDKQP